MVNSLKFHELKYVLQETLDSIREVWNTHKLRTHKNGSAPAGRPVIMYRIPQIYGTNDFAVNADPGLMGQLRQQCTFKDYNRPCSVDAIYNICSYLMNEHHVEPASNAEDGCALFIFLREEIYWHQQNR